jgi:hypothetical protein
MRQVIALFTLLAACNEAVDEPTRYSRVPPEFEDEASCLEAFDGELIFSCGQSLDLCPDGRVSMVMSDVINEGTYTIMGHELTARFELHADVPEQVTFTIRADGSLQALAVFGERWFAIDTRYPDAIRCGETD